jgi:hypothetical protein
MAHIWDNYKGIAYHHSQLYNFIVGAYDHSNEDEVPISL